MKAPPAQGQTYLSQAQPILRPKNVTLKYILNIISIRPEIGVKSLSLTMLHQAIVLFYVDDIHQPASVELTLPNTNCV